MSDSTPAPVDPIQHVVAGAKPHIDAAGVSDRGQSVAGDSGGRERSADEFRALFDRAGFELTRIIPTKSPVCVIEARKG